GDVASVGGVTGAGPEDEHAETAMLHTSTATATRRLRVRISRSSASPATGTVRLMADTVAARLGAALGARSARTSDSASSDSFLTPRPIAMATQIRSRATPRS